jgi:DNA-3-methyladenine glycosylase I
MNEINRCSWCMKDKLYQDYHDYEWGVPVLEDHKMFEFLILETFQAGLSWYTILAKRENFRNAFDHFDYHKIATYNQEKVNELMLNTGIVRNQLKINATISNAVAFIEIQKKYSSFCNYIWEFVNHKPIINHWKSISEIPSSTVLSDTISKDLKKKGFKFVGSTVVYAHLQATGIVNDHLIDCFKRLS